MLAGRGLPSVPEEDLLPEVGDTPELAAAPNLQYTARVTTSTFLDTSSSPSHTGGDSLAQHPVFSPDQTSGLPETQRPEHQAATAHSPPGYHVIPAPHHHHHQQLQQQSVTPPQLPQTSNQLQPQTSPQLHQPQTPPQLHQSHTSPQLQPAGPASPGLQQSQLPRSFIRSHSQQELGTQQLLQQQQTASHHENSFIIPKPLPRRRSHSSGGSNSSGGCLVGSPSLVPHQVVSSVPITTLPHCTLASTVTPPCTLTPIAPALATVTVQGPSRTLVSAPVIASVQPGTSSANSALLAQLLTAGPYQVSSSQTLTGGHLSTISNVGQLSNLKSNIMTVSSSNSEVKASLVIPGVVTGSSGAACITSSSTMKPVVTTSLIVPPITLNAVTPSTLKTQPHSQPQSPWSPCSPGIIKQSPPHQEPSSPLMINIPSPSNKPFRPKTDSDRVQYKEHRRVCHINAEQKRRSNLKNNFDMMHQLIPSISQNANSKISKAVMLQKGADYIHQLKNERQQLSEQSEKLRADIERLSCEISNAQAMLPATGAPMTHARYSKLKEMFTKYVQERTRENWKFWIFSLITEPLLESYNKSVSTSCLDDLCRSSLAWLDQQCSLNILRPLVSSSMRKLSTTTNVLADPENLPEEIFCRITKQEEEKFHHW